MFVLGKLFQLNLMFAGKVGAYPSEAPFKCFTLLSRLKFVGKARSLPLSGAPINCMTCVGSGLNGQKCTRLEKLPGTNTLAYYRNTYITAVNSFITMAPGVCTIKLLTSVIYRLS